MPEKLVSSGNLTESGCKWFGVPSVTSPPSLLLSWL